MARVPVIAALAPVKRALNLRAQTRFVKTTLPRVETVSSGASRAISTQASWTKGLYGAKSNSLSEGRVSPLYFAS